MAKKRKKTVGQVFLQYFVRSILCVLLLLACGFTSYKATMLYYKVTGATSNSGSLSKYIKEIKSDGVAEEVAKNLILATDSDSGKIKRIVIEICNKNTGNIDYITVPSTLEFTMSYDLYKKLATANADIPQIVCMQNIHKYFSGESLYQCAQLLLEDVMDIEFSYYTVIPDTVYKEMFVTEKGSGVQKWSKSYKAEMESLKDEKAYKAFFKKYYEKVDSNLPEKSKCEYIDTYLKAVPNQLAFTIVSGEKSGKSFVLSVEETNFLINKLLKNEAYTEKNQKKKEGENTSSMGLAIEILNSTQINGLASSMQEKLVEKGFNIAGIGNYSGDTLEHTKIIVKEQGMGEDLLAYFKNAEIEVGELSQNVDIRIIIGSDVGN